MNKPTNTQKRSKLTIILLGPGLLFIFMIGWTLYWIGQRHPKQPQKPVGKALAKQNEFELMMIPKQEEETLTS